MEPLLTEQQAAAVLNVSVKTLQGWRLRGGGPPYQKLGRCVRYERAALATFVQAAVRHSTSERGFGDPCRPGRPQIQVEHFLAQSGRAPIRSAAGSVTALPRAQEGPPAVPTRRRHVVRLTAHRVTVRPI